MDIFDIAIDRIKGFIPIAIYVLIVGVFSVRNDNTRDLLLIYLAILLFIYFTTKE